MANEIKFTPSIVYVNGALRRTIAPGTLNIPQATKGIMDLSVSATTGEADLSVTLLGTPGMAVIQNLEPTTTGKTLNWGWKSSTGGIPQYAALKPKQFHVVTYGTSSMTIRYKAASGTCAASFTVFES